MERETYKSTQEREQTFRTAIYHLRHNPAYLTLFALGLAGGSVVVAAFFRSTNSNVAIVATVSWIVFLIASLLVVAFVESRRTDAKSIYNYLIEDKANNSFFGSRSAERLTGRWNIFWYEGHGDDRQPYAPDPHEIANISTYGSMIFISSYDESMDKEEETYWLLGRMSDNLDVSLMYWGPKGRADLLTGVVFLEVSDTFEDKWEVMTGQWMGRTRDEKITIGDVEFIKYSRKINDLEST